MNRLFLIPLTAVVLWGATGCKDQDRAAKEHSAASAEPAVEPGIVYSPKHGLAVPVETARFIGLETGEVEEHSIQGTSEISACVFRVATASEPHALASALVPSADAGLLAPGLISLIRAGSPSGELLRIDRSREAQSGMVEAILRVGDEARTLREGSWVTVRFATGATNAVIAVPRTAMFHTLEGDFVYVVNGEHFTRAAVKPGRTDGEFVEVSDGLLAGDKVVTRPVMTLWMTELHNVNGGDACCVKREPKP